jgi:hypothetical protein
MQSQNVNIRNTGDNSFKGVTKQYSIIFNSGSNLNTFVSPNRDSFTVTLNNPISVPAEAKSCSIGLYQANIWNSSPNIITDVNDKFYFTYASTDYTIIFPQGLYSLNDFNATLSSLVFDSRAGLLPKDLFTFFGNTATQKVQVALNYVGTQLRFNGPDNMAKILGFEDGVNYPLSPSNFAGQIIFAPNIANFNTINSFLVTTDLVNNGLPINAQSASIIAQVPITAAPNSLITYSPVQIVWILCDHLIGHPRSSITFRLTNEFLGSVVVLEDWNIILSVKYEV